jgi:predicted MPP superfamily phosphohydrolase
MWAADLAFNGLLLVVDWIAFRRWNQSPFLRAALVAVLYGITILLLALAVTYFNGLRIFATFRFIGMALFWHVPVLLFCMKRFVSIAIGVFLLSFYIYAYHVEPHRLEITHYEFKHSLLRPLERPLVVAQVSDIQTDHVGDFEKNVLQQLSGLQPDMIIHTGDYLHCWTRSGYAEQATALATMLKNANLNPRFGSYAVKGDADEAQLWKNVFGSLPVKTLEDETLIVPLGRIEVSITGLSRQTSRSSSFAELHRAMTGAKPGTLRIFIGHSPDYIRALEFMESPFLAFAGHTHGGQVQIPGIGPLMTLTRIPQRYADYYGPYGSGILSVSRGIGMERRDAPRLRFLCRPELRIITLSGKNES